MLYISIHIFYKYNILNLKKDLNKTTKLVLSNLIHVG